MSRRLVFEQIRQRGTTSRAEIVSATGLSKATVSSIVAELLAAGLVQETGIVSAAIGRPRVLLEMVPDAFLALGGELSDDECRVVLTNVRAEPLARATHHVSDSSADALLQVLDEAVHEVIRGVDASCILGLGVAIPGIVHPPSGLVSYSVIINWENVPLGEKLAQRFPWRRVGVFSRGHAATWGEYRHGAGQGVSNLAYVRAGTGIGLGLVLNGSLYVGDIYGAGGIGHTTVQPDGELCRCGNRGCLETVASTGALLRLARKLLSENCENPLWRDLQGDLDGLSFQMLTAAAHQGNPLAIQTLAAGGRWLGLAISTVVNLLTPEMIIFGGPLAQAGDFVLNALRGELLQRSVQSNVSRVKVVPSALKEDAPAVGAASLVMHELTAPLQLSMTLPLYREGPGLFDGEKVANDFLREARQAYWPFPWGLDSESDYTHPKEG
ncbi:MAG: ROK family protein [Anaerolineae bacterium]